MDERWSGDGERAGVSAGADTKANALGASGALELLDLCLFENGSKRGGALISDPVLLETVNERRDEDGERAGVSAGADTKANTLGAAAHLSSEILVSLRTAASLVTPSSPILLLSRLYAKGRG